MAFNIEKQGTTLEEKTELLRAAGVNPSIVRHCLPGSTGYARGEKPSVVDAGYPRAATIVPRVGKEPAPYSEPSSFKINTKRKLSI